MADSTYSRSREEFGAHAVDTLNGVKQIVQSLAGGYDALNNIPPHHDALIMAIDTLIDATDEHLVKNNPYTP